MDKHFPYIMTHRLRISHELANRNADIFSAHGWKMSEEMEGDGWRFSSTELMKPEDDIGSDPQFRCLGDINIK